ncbi:hypothetical protein B9Q02_11520 [Candidatus Marsarchaeota G1 archaeon BE_D]|uniref:Uncharacterized protein n=1 Tax=Candidatus Marsarchaeota G1 archaeon BE_D TaxID=1978156 RepID=A0A2R6A7Y8_9ARCH|nr:MAG: hypothetical protein B9Q02_11520 [Candidatus Marsarchaeota G1 archaeon BE_D]
MKNKHIYLLSQRFYLGYTLIPFIALTVKIMSLKFIESEGLVHQLFELKILICILKNRVGNLGQLL